jgi:hypothetical protein
MAISDTHLVSCKDTHPFAQAAHDAFYKHYPLIISPDDVWFCITQGFASHVNLNAERLRHHFVKHEGKEKLVVERPDFLLGQSNPWPEVFTSFSDQIADHVGRHLRDLVVADFSTTTAFHRAASEVALMDAFQPYFEYEMLCGCGIPEITLTGAPDDWRDIRRRATELARFGLDAWIRALLPILDALEATSRGYADPDFWKSFFRYKSWSGGSEMTGWINVLFPYLKGTGQQKGKLISNPYLNTWRTDHLQAVNDSSRRHMFGDKTNGPYLLQIPAGLSSAPVRVTDRRSNDTHDMRFVAGMFGIAQDPTTMGLSASFGWAIVYDKPLPVTPRIRTPKKSPGRS